MADPTGARHRDFDIPVIIPRVAFIDLPPLVDEAGTPVTPVTTATCTPTTTTTTVFVASPVVATAGKPAPVVKIGLPKLTDRRASVLRTDGLAFAVESSKAITDVEIRLLELLPKGVKRTLGVKLVIEPKGTSLTAIVLPTPFAKFKLAKAGKRSVRVVVIVTAKDGTVGQGVADFALVR